jgi:hypothetical protein
MSLTESTTEGRLGTLKALRDRLAADIDGTTSARDVAPLAQRLMDVLAQIDELGGGLKVAEKKTGLSDFEQRLRDREQAKNSRRSKSG